MADHVSAAAVHALKHFFHQYTGFGCLPCGTTNVRAGLRGHKARGRGGARAGTGGGCQAGGRDYAARSHVHRAARHTQRGTAHGCHSEGGCVGWRGCANCAAGRVQGATQTVVATEDGVPPPMTSSERGYAARTDALRISRHKLAPTSCATWLRTPRGILIRA